MRTYETRYISFKKSKTFSYIKRKDRQNNLFARITHDDAKNKQR